MKIALIPKNIRRTGKLLEPQYLTIHSTANSRSTAQNERDNLARPDNPSKAGFHMVVDDREAIICIPLDEVAYHAGSIAGNTQSIGLEICESGNRQQTINNAAYAAAKILNNYGWGTYRLRQHYDWTGKNCPRILRAKNLWKQFVKKVDKELKSMTNIDLAKAAVAKLQARGIISNADYWLKAILVVNNLDDLVIKLASFI